MVLDKSWVEEKDSFRLLPPNTSDMDIEKILKKEIGGKKRTQAIASNLLPISLQQNHHWSCHRHPIFRPLLLSLPTTLSSPRIIPVVLPITVCKSKPKASSLSHIHHQLEIFNTCRVPLKFFILVLLLIRYPRPSRDFEFVNFGIPTHSLLETTSKFVVSS